MTGHNQKLMIVTLIVVAIVAIGAFFIFKPHKKMPGAAVIPTAGLPTLGDKNAPNEIVAFEDLKCGNCARYNQSLFPQINDQLIKTGKVRYSVVLLAFIPGSPPAANAAYCLNQQNPDFFFPFVEYVYSNQPPEDQDWAKVSTLVQMANSSVAKADSQKLSLCLIDGNYDKQIAANLELAEKVMGKTVGTPTLFVNGHKLTDFSISGIKAFLN